MTNTEKITAKVISFELWKERNKNIAPRYWEDFCTRCPNLVADEKLQLCFEQII